jgi:hypothetical protein
MAKNIKKMPKSLHPIEEPCPALPPATAPTKNNPFSAVCGRITCLYHAKENSSMVMHSAIKMGQCHEIFCFRYFS